MGYYIYNMAINFNIHCDNVDMPKEDLVNCNFTARLMRLPLGIIFLIVGLIFVVASSEWVPRIIGTCLLLAGLGFFGVLIFNRQLSEREWNNNQEEIKQHMSMTSKNREDAIKDINATRVAFRAAAPQSTISTRNSNRAPSWSITLNN